MLPNSSGEENVERTYHRRLFPLPAPFSKIVTPPFLPDSVFTLFRENEEIIYLEAVLANRLEQNTVNQKHWTLQTL